MTLEVYKILLEDLGTNAKGDAMALMRNRTAKTKKRILAISTAPAAMPVSGACRMTNGRVNPAQELAHQGITGLGNVYYNGLAPALIEAAVQRGEGKLGLGGAFLVSTGQFTGRSPKDKHVVRTPSVEKTIWWENNAAQSPEGFERLYQDMLAHMQGRDYFVQDLYAGADPLHRLDVRVVTELAWHGLFIRHMLRRPERAELDSFVPEWSIINCPTFKADPARHGCRTETVIALNFDKKTILIANPKAHEQFVYPPGSLIGQSIDLLVPTSIRPQHADMRKRFMAGSGHRAMDRVNGDFRAVDSRGREFPVELGLTRLPLVDGHPACACVMVRDITERKHYEQTIAEQLEFQRVLLDTLPYPIFFKDAEAHYLGFNQAFLDVFNVRREDLIGKTVLQFMDGAEADRLPLIYCFSIPKSTKQVLLLRRLPIS